MALIRTGMFFTFLFWIFRRIYGILFLSDSVKLRKFEIFLKKIRGFKEIFFGQNSAQISSWMTYYSTELDQKQNTPWKPYFYFIISERTYEALNVLRTLEKDIANEEFNENTIQAVCHCYKVC